MSAEVVAGKMYWSLVKACISMENHHVYWENSRTFDWAMASSLQTVSQYQKVVVTEVNDPQ